jgi:hypothetical protein
MAGWLAGSERKKKKIKEKKKEKRKRKERRKRKKGKERKKEERRNEVCTRLTVHKKGKHGESTGGNQVIEKQGEEGERDNMNGDGMTARK